MQFIERASYVVHDYNRDTKIAWEVFQKPFIGVEAASGAADANDSEFTYRRDLLDETLAAAVF